MATPGLHLVHGSFRRLDLAVGGELYLLARVPDDPDSRLFTMRYADASPCAIPNVGRYATSRVRNQMAALVAYFHEDAQQGTLHFADTNCKLYEWELEDAWLPIGETEEGNVVIRAGNKVLALDLDSGQKEVLSDDVQEVIRGVFSGRNLVITRGKLQIFSSQWKDQGIFGGTVAGLIRASDSLIYQDEAGIHRINAAGGDAVQEKLIIEDACGLGTQDEVWVTYRAPCTSGSLVAYHAPSERTYTLNFDADPRYLKFASARTGGGQDPSKDRFWFFMIRDMDNSTGLGRLVVRTPEAEEHQIGERATLWRFEFQETATEAHGYALVNVDGGLASYAWWNGAGESKILAEKVLTRPRRLIVDYDGTSGKLAITSGDRISIVAEGVPSDGFEFRDGKGQWTAIFHDWSGGSTGRLSSFSGTLDGAEKAPLDQPFAAPELETVSESVAAFHVAPLGDVLPGVLYLTDYDPVSDTGTLYYRNLELRFTAIVNRRVADYVIARDQVLYSIPEGDDAGIWLVSGK